MAAEQPTSELQAGDVQGTGELHVCIFIHATKSWLEALK